MDLRTKRTICLLIGIASILTIVSTISYAFFTVMADVTLVESVIGTANVSVKFADYGVEVGGELAFGSSITKKFTIENTGSSDAKVKMYWNNLVNTYLKGSLTYTLSYSENGNGPYEEVIGKTNVPRSRKPLKEVLADDLTIPVGKIYYYSLIITLNNLLDVDQTPDLKAVFNSSFAVEDINYTLPIATGTIKAVTSNYSGEIWGYKSSIKKIVFEDALIPKESYANKFDISADKNGSVMSYLVRDTEDSTKYIAYIQGENGVLANENSFCLFHNFTNLEKIENISLLDTRNVKNMGNMFAGCNKLVALDLSDFDTSNVISMGYMFGGCNNLKTLNLSGFDTSNVENMSQMFGACSSLKALDLSSFDTSNVTDMNRMFDCCYSLTSLDLSSFDTGNVTDMNQMFVTCTSLTSLNISNFDTSNVTNMTSMFNGCRSLTSIDLSSFDTSNVTDMSNMFINCSNLTTTITIRRTSAGYSSMFNNASTTSGQITVNYTSDASSLVDSMIATKSVDSNVIKGSLVN